MAVETRRYPVVYGGWIGALIAVLVIVAVLVLWLSNKIDAQTALLISALAVARLT